MTHKTSARESSDDRKEHLPQRRTAQEDNGSHNQGSVHQLIAHPVYDGHRLLLIDTPPPLPPRFSACSGLSLSVPFQPLDLRPLSISAHPPSRCTATVTESSRSSPAHLRISQFIPLPTRLWYTADPPISKSCAAHCTRMGELGAECEESEWVGRGNTGETEELNTLLQMLLLLAWRGGMAWRCEIVSCAALCCVGGAEVGEWRSCCICE